MSKNTVKMIQNTYVINVLSRPSGYFSRRSHNRRQYMTTLKSLTAVSDLVNDDDNAGKEDLNLHQFSQDGQSIDDIINNVHQIISSVKSAGHIQNDQPLQDSLSSNTGNHIQVFL